MKSISRVSGAGLSLSISELTSPKIILSLFLRSVSFKQRSNLYNDFMESLGGLYHVVIKNGLTLLFMISISVSLRSGLRRKFTEFLTKKPIPPPDLFLFLETHSYPSMFIKPVGIVPSILVH